ncbi:putative DMT domain-containing membrane protein [Aeromonas diversa CDC 2478-85]|uniref:Putative DMT domain-containing membrane protein n=1 Tax=Aeromonas diversa CDC 2478-85 TaxID=1268237 RepID=N9VG96_9GAMM|nr:DMT family transporter [Aeromonas diversa]ENY70426.1 putative DMT domain-containing membrane protein [Aeromonas diversa CDC 2478-85]
MSLLRLALLTGSTLVAFAANSLLCRLALTQAAMDPALFTLLRLASGALMLGWLTRTRPRTGDWRGGLALFVYAGAFSFAYLSLGAGSGALILFASVQITMLAPPLWRGERLPTVQWLGLAMAMGGLIWLLLPGLRSPDPLGAVLMACAGIAWASYTLAGGRAADALAANAGHFWRAALLALPLMLLLGHAAFSPGGVLLALLSGAIASGLGYALWYSVLPDLGRTLAAALQLLVPPLAAVGGILWLGESWSLRLLLSALAILGGIALIIAGKARQGAPR